MAAVKSLCTRCLILENGGVVFDGETDDAITYYLRNQEMIFNTDLSLSKNRSGDEKVKFVEFYIENEKGQVIENVLNGDFVNFCFKIYAQNLLLIPSNIDLGFSIQTSENELITVLYSSYQNNVVKIEKSGYYTIKCGIPSFSINQGEYIVKGRILCNNVESDWLKDPLGKINVMKGDFYNTGNLGFDGKSKFLIKGQWELVD